MTVRGVRVPGGALSTRQKGTPFCPCWITLATTADIDRVYVPGATGAVRDPETRVRGCPS
jgi:hypothetical protein